MREQILAMEKMEHMTFFYAELGLMQYSTVMYRPSLIAASAVYVAHCTLKKSPLWNETLKRHSGYTDRQLFWYNLITAATLLFLMAYMKKVFNSPGLPRVLFTTSEENNHVIHLMGDWGCTSKPLHQALRCVISGLYGVGGSEDENETSN